MIPRILHRVVPCITSDEVERFWQQARELHPDWDLRTWRDPLDPVDWSITAPHWDRCDNGAQFAGLIRLEALYRDGGVYLDSDFETYRPFDSLTGAAVFAGYEDSKVIPDAVLGAEQGHPAIKACLDLAIERLDTSGWRSAWESGPGVTTEVLRGCDEALLLPPESFYPYPYTETRRRNEDHRTRCPAAFGAHHWAASWLPPDRKPKR